MTPRDQSTMLKTIRGLLAKAESTEFAAEAEAFTAKAQELMAAHSIEMAMFADRVGSRCCDPASIDLRIERPYAEPKAHLLAAVARANHCEVIYSRYDESAIVFGFEHDLAAVELLFTSLLVQATRAMTDRGSQTDWSGVNRTRSFRRAFLVGFASRIGRRLGEASAASQRTAAVQDSAVLPVLADRDERVKAAVRDRFPEVGTLETSSSNVSGWFAGEAAADRADLGHRPIAS